MKRPIWLRLPPALSRRVRSSPQPADKAGGRLAALRAGLSNRLVVLDFNGFLLRGALVVSRRGEPRILVHGESHLPTIEAALTQVLDQLRAGGEPLPRRCVAASIQVLAAEVHLPVAPNQPRKRQQMLDLIRWELEPLVGQATLHWNLGAVLTAMGYLTPAQRLEIAGDQRRHNGLPLRFGDRAVELGHITDSQLERALAGQKLIQGASAEFDCDYAAMAGEPHDGHWAWLGTAVDRGVRSDWYAACKAQGLRLQYLYPRAGLGALAVTAEPEWDGDGVEIRLDGLVSWSCRAGRLTVFREESRPESAIEPEDIIAQLPARPGGDKIQLHYHVDSPEPGLAPGLASVWRNARLISPDGLDPAWVPLYGLAAHALDLRGAAVCARLKGRERPAFYRHPEFLRLTVSTLAVAGLVWGEADLQLRLARGEDKLARIETEFRQEGQQAQQIQAAQAQTATLQKEVESLRSRVVELANRAELLDARLLGRLDQVPALLRTLAAAVGPEVVLESVREAGRQDGYNVVAWGTRDAPLLEFARNAQDLLARIDQGVVNTEFSASEGRTGAPGYRVSFWVVRDPDALLQSAAEQSGAMSPLPPAPDKPAGGNTP